MEQFYLGIDVSKGYSDFTILNKEKITVCENFQLDDTFIGHNLLYEKIGAFCKKHPDSTIYAAVESTGGYENNWYKSLLEYQGVLNIQTARLNPLGVNFNSKANLKRNTTDPISAQNVAEYMISHPEKILYQQEDSLASLRKQWGFIKILTKQSAQLLNQLESLLYCANPGILVYCKNGTPGWVFKLLAKYPTALNLAKVKAKTLTKIPYITLERAKVVIDSAKESVASTTDVITQQLIVATVKQIINLEKTIKEQMKIMTKNCSIPEVELLKTFTGIGDYSAIGLIIEIQSVRRFPSVKTLAAFFGLHPELKISGDKTAAFRMSKKGRKAPREILFMVAMSAISCNPLIKEIYQDRVAKGMNKMAAIGLCMHKILRIIYGMLKSNKAFDPEVDKRNREKSKPENQNSSKNRSRRLQKYDAKAPISRRQHAKRKEQEESHSDNITKSGIIAPTPSTE